MADQHEATITKLRQKVEDEEAQENGQVEEEIENADFQDVETEASKSSVREYVVLVNTGQMWKELGRTAASTADKAIHTILGEKLEANVEYVGVPIRSWQPTSFEPQTRTTYKKTTRK